MEVSLKVDKATIAFPQLCSDSKPSTTTLLTAAMLEAGGVPSAAAGNVGTALSSFAGRIGPVNEG